MIYGVCVWREKNFRSCSHFFILSKLSAAIGNEKSIAKTKLNRKPSEAILKPKQHDQLAVKLITKIKHFIKSSSISNLVPLWKEKPNRSFEGGSTENKTHI